jgi:hypothetical protein
VCAIVAIAFAFAGLPGPETGAPVVVAAVVLSHALLSIGAGALAYALARFAERLLAAPGAAPRGDRHVE